NLMDKIYNMMKKDKPKDQVTKEDIIIVGEP
ncbi:MAG TPA: sporulation protein YtfJ, partial [Desulfitobacterium dehalogenans]|nr:sporulation protein YtfJ [Desulfitobacterium dehalogenans]